MQNFILSAITFLPLVGMLLVLATPGKYKGLIRWGTVAFSLLPFGLSIVARARRPSHHRLDAGPVGR